MSDFIRVLLIDDEKLFVESLSKVLRKRGMEVLAAHNGLQALELLANGRKWMSSSWICGCREWTAWPRWKRFGSGIP